MPIDQSLLGERIEYIAPTGEYVNLLAPPYIIVGRDGDGMTKHDVISRRAPGQHGSTFVTAQRRGREMVYYTIVETTTLRALEEAEGRLIRIMDPALGEGILRHTRADTAVRQINVICADGLDLKADARIGFSRRLSLLFAAGDPSWYEPVDTVLTFGGAGSGFTFPVTFPVTFSAASAAVGAPYTLNYRGTVPAEPVITFTGPVVDPEAHNATSGEYVKVLTNVPAGGTLTIDMRRAQKSVTATVGDTTFDLMSYVTDDSRFWAIARGTTRILLAVASPGVGVTAELRFATRYLSVRD